MVIREMQQVEVLKIPLRKIRFQKAEEKCYSSNIIANTLFYRTLFRRSHPWIYRYGTWSILINNGGNPKTQLIWEILCHQKSYSLI